MSKAQEFRDKSSDELHALVFDLRKKVFLLLNDAKTNKKNDSPHKVRNARKEIARLLTVIREKELNQEAR